MQINISNRFSYDFARSEEDLSNAFQSLVVSLSYFDQYYFVPVQISLSAQKLFMMCNFIMLHVPFVILEICILIVVNLFSAREPKV